MPRSPLPEALLRLAKVNSSSVPAIMVVAMVDDILAGAGHAALPTNVASRTLVAFAPFSDVRSYELSQRQAPPPAPTIVPGLKVEMPEEPSAELPPRPEPPATPHTARILGFHQAAMEKGCSMQALAFSRSVESSRSPRIITLSPRRPLPNQLPRTLSRMPHSARGSAGGSPRGGKSNVQDELKAAAYLKELNLFTDKSWLLYPQTQRERAQDVHRSSIMMTALPDDELAHDPIAAARVAAARANAAANRSMFDHANLSLDALAGDEEETDEEGSRPTSFRPARTSGSTVTFDAASTEPSPRTQRKPTGPERQRTQSFMKRAEEGEVLAALTSVKWFKDLPKAEIQQLMRRAKHRMVPRWSTIIREGAVGSVFYVLLKGSVQVTSTSGLNLVLPAGVSFGEGALVTSVRREATVLALEPCHLIQVTHANLDDLSVELSALKCHVIGQVLAKFTFFAQMEELRRHALANLLEIEYVQAHGEIFNEGDPGDKFYMLQEGRVGIYRGLLTFERAADGSRAFPLFKRDPEEDSDAALLLGEFRQNHQYPWFGEMALFSSSPRSASAIALEPTKLLALDRSKFNAFMQIIPTFEQMFATSTAAYSKLNAITQTTADGRQLVRQRTKAREAFEAGEDEDKDARLGTLDIFTLGTEDAPASAVDLLGDGPSKPLERSRREIAFESAPPPANAPMDAPVHPPVHRLDTLKRGISSVVAAQRIEVIENEFVRHARNSIAPNENGSGSVSPATSPSFARASPRAARPANL